MKRKMRQKIEISPKRRAELAKMFGITIQNVGLALSFKRNSSVSEKIREAALASGGRLVQIIDVTEEVRKAVKELNAKGEVIREITL